MVVVVVGLVETQVSAFEAALSEVVEPGWVLGPASVVAAVGYVVALVSLASVAAAEVVVSAAGRHLVPCPAFVILLDR